MLFVLCGCGCLVTDAGGVVVGVIAVSVVGAAFVVVYVYFL